MEKTKTNEPCCGNNNTDTNEPCCGNNSTDTNEPCCGNNSTDTNEPCCENNSTDTSSSSNSCCCGKPDGRKTPKVLICVVILLAVVSIIAYRTIGAATGGNAAPNDTAALAFGQPSSAITLLNGTVNAEENLGEYIGSLDELNMVAVNTDAVFVYIPASGNVLVDNTTKTNVIKFQQDLKNNNINAGLYTLWHDTPEYAEIARQVKLPIIFVANKGTGAVTIPGNNVNEYLLYQAFQACCDASPGCCP